MVGTAPQICTPSRSISASTLPASNRPSASTIFPPVRKWVSRLDSPPTWNIGVVARLTACGESAASRCGRRRLRCRMLCWLLITERRDSSTAFGIPELPEVNRISAGSSCERNGGGTSSAESASNAARRSASAVVGVSTGSSVSASTWRGASRSTACLISAALHHRLASTGTAPASHSAHSATTHSGLL